MVDFITLVGNNMIVLASCYFCYECWKWVNKYGHDWTYILFIVAILMIVVSTGVRVGWWSPAIKFAPPGQTYHQFFLDNRHIPSLLSACGFTAGILMVVGYVDETTSPRGMVAAGVGIGALSIVIGLL